MKPTRNAITKKKIKFEFIANNVNDDPSLAVYFVCDISYC